jgi:hypothetical protein
VDRAAGIRTTGTGAFSTNGREKMNLQGARFLCVAVGSLLLYASILDAQAEDPSLRNRFGISVDIDSKKGVYSVKYRGQLWLGFGFVSVLANNQWYRSAQVKFPHSLDDQRSGVLMLEDVERDSGEDHLGPYETVSLRWKVPTRSDQVITGFRLYRDSPYSQTSIEGRNRELQAR